jgi:hypothetical protein
MGIMEKLMVNWNINLTSILLIVGLVVSVGLVTKVGCTNAELKGTVDALNEEKMQADLELGRANTRFGNAEKYIGELEETIQSEIKERKAAVKMAAFWKGKYSAEVASRDIPTLPIDPTEEQPTVLCRSAEFQQYRLYRAKTIEELEALIDSRAEFEDHRITIGCQLSAIQKEDNIQLGIGYQLHMKLAGEIVSTLEPSGAVNYYLNVYELGKDGEKIGKLKLTKFSAVVEDKRSERFRWWAPHVDAGVVLGMTNSIEVHMAGNIGVSLMGYGVTDNDLSWRFARLGLEFSGNTFGISADPVLINIGEYIPLVSNIWLSPHVVLRLDMDAQYAAGIMIGAVL